uniref:Uncharacterized protein anti-RAF1 n=1 Tax=Seriola quinqueradiata TaxID=8161 RepID=Q76K92_SERQU|nr:Dna-J homologous hypothetical protein [Seriola quinqueradiata]BAC99058.1 Dna-J homologous hypothetical protein [Seriola quinqueradiata]BAC99067.1 Dna-J homologous hypothetical protein [Seriola quinqueradiata]
MGLFETCDSNEIKHLKSFHHVFFFALSSTQRATKHKK